MRSTAGVAASAGPDSVPGGAGAQAPEIERWCEGSVRPVPGRVPGGCRGRRRRCRREALATPRWAPAAGSTGAAPAAVGVAGAGGVTGVPAAVAGHRAAVVDQKRQSQWCASGGVTPWRLRPRHSGWRLLAAFSVTLPPLDRGTAVQRHVAGAGQVGCRPDDVAGGGNAAADAVNGLLAVRFARRPRPVDRAGVGEVAPVFTSVMLPLLLMDTTQCARVWWLDRPGARQHGAEARHLVAHVVGARLRRR